MATTLEKSSSGVSFRTTVNAAVGEKQNGISNNRELVSFDVLYGFVVLRPEWTYRMRDVTYAF